MVKKIKKNQRHIIWNWEESPDQVNMVRYHVIVIDDKNRATTLNSFLEPVMKVGSLDPIREVNGKVVGTKFRYLFRTYDSNANPNMLYESFISINKPIKRDKELYERIKKDHSIENYVADLYGN